MATSKLIRIDADVTAKIAKAQRPRETVNDVLRRLLGLGTKRHRIAHEKPEEER